MMFFVFGASLAKIERREISLQVTRLSIQNRRDIAPILQMSDP
ncbi:MAG: hypothetical protein PHH28_10130 [Desulfuromonadaceae bacterium]|nr:hypothetical protein [Desulfuromonadaceae bacterium]